MCFCEKSYPGGVPGFLNGRLKSFRDKDSPTGSVIIGTPSPIHAKWTLTSSMKAVLSPPAVSRPLKAIVCAPAATVNAAVM